AAFVEDARSRHDLAGPATLVMEGAGTMQKIEMADGGASDDEARRAGCCEPAIGAGKVASAAKRHRIDRFVLREPGGVANDRAHGVERDLAQVGGVEAQLRHLAA